MKLVAVTVAILFGVGASSAEGQQAGVYLGMSAARAYPHPPSAEWLGINTVVAAAFVELGNGIVRVRPELQLLRRGGVQTDRRASIRMTHVTLPILVALSPDLNGIGVRPVAYAGPVMGVRIGCHAEQVTVEGASLRQGCARAGWNPGRWELGGTFGGGLHVPIGASTLLLEARHARTFTTTGDQPEYQQIRASATSLVAGVAVRVR